MSVKNWFKKAIIFICCFFVFVMVLLTVIDVALWIKYPPLTQEQIDMMKFYMDATSGGK